MIGVGTYAAVFPCAAESAFLVSITNAVMELYCPVPPLNRVLRAGAEASHAQHRSVKASAPSSRSRPDESCVAAQVGRGCVIAAFPALGASAASSVALPSNTRWGNAAAWSSAMCEAYPLLFNHAKARKGHRRYRYEATTLMSGATLPFLPPAQYYGYSHLDTEFESVHAAGVTVVIDCTSSEVDQLADNIALEARAAMRGAAPPILAAFIAQSTAEIGGGCVSVCVSQVSTFSLADMLDEFGNCTALSLQLEKMVEDCCTRLIDQFEKLCDIGVCFYDMHTSDVVFNPSLCLDDGGSSWILRDGCYFRNTSSTHLDGQPNVTNFDARRCIPAPSGNWRCVSLFLHCAALCHDTQQMHGDHAHSLLMLAFSKSEVARAALESAKGACRDCEMQGSADARHSLNTLTAAVLTASALPDATVSDVLMAATAGRQQLCVNGDNRSRWGHILTQGDLKTLCALQTVISKRRASPLSLV